MLRLCRGPRPLLSGAKKAGGEGRVAEGAGKLVFVAGVCAGSPLDSSLSAPARLRSGQRDSHFGRPAARQALEAGTSLCTSAQLWVCIPLAHGEQLVPGPGIL